MKRVSNAVAFLLLFVTGAVRADPADLRSNSSPQVTLTRSEQALVSLRVQPARALRVPPQIEAFGQVLNPAPLVVLDAAIETAAATADVSSAEAMRLQQLYTAGRNTSLKTLQAAQVQALADRLKRNSLRQRLRLDWGAVVATLTTAQRNQLIQQLVAGRAVLVRADVPGGTADAAPIAATLRALNGGGPIVARVLGPAPTVDPALQAPAWLLQVGMPGAEVLRPGQALRIALRLRGAAQPAVLIPETAIVRIRGIPYAYVQEGSDRFQRRALTLRTWQGDGWAAGGQVGPGDKLVIAGASALWRAEQAPGLAAKSKSEPQDSDGDDD
ncbi:MAG: hypothetical protein B7Z66_11720 [Chromatiales bacterium 21-64-14]|nr:MAG: hypothetical protein B7Z66_11720 [Chromatiales bacterium 21-64-14]